MTISCNNFQVEAGRTNEHESACLNFHMGQMGYSIEMMVADGVFFLCQKNGNLYIIGVPNEGWKRDIEREGFKVLQPLRALSKQEGK